MRITEGMKRNHIRAFCRRCKHEQEFVRYEPHHRWHLFTTLLTGGLWVVSWLSVCVGAWFRPWRCKGCGWHDPQLNPPVERTHPPRSARLTPEPSTDTT